MMMNPTENFEDFDVTANIYYTAGLMRETTDFVHMFKNVPAKM